jgi:hypothetical protein
MVTVQGKSQEVEAVLTQIERAEHQVPQCALPAAPSPQPKATTPSDGK